MARNRARVDAQPHDEQPVVAAVPPVAEATPVAAAGKPGGTQGAAIEKPARQRLRGTLCTRQRSASTIRGAVCGSRSRRRCGPIWAHCSSGCGSSRRPEPEGRCLAALFY